MAGIVVGGSCTPRSSNELREDAAPSAANVAPQVAADPIDQLRPFEDDARRALDFRHPPSAETGLGADPWAIRRVPGGWVGILRGRSSVVLLDDALRELARAKAPRSTTGLAIAPNGDVLVVGDLSPVVARFAVRGRALVPLGEARVSGVLGLRDVAVSPAGAVWVLDERGGRALRLKVGGDAVVVSSVAVGHGASQVLATAKHVVVDCITEHQLVVVPIDATGAPSSREPVRITHDGPLWGFDARETSSGLVLVAGGVEDHPLDRKGGFFGWIDSFVYAYAVADGGAARAPVTKLASLNVSEYGVVTPKALVLEETTAARLGVLVASYGSARGARLGLALTPGGHTTVDELTLLPGVRALERSGTDGPRAFAMANPLLDAWMLFDERGLAEIVPVAGETPRPMASRLGEALFFTSLMAPRNSSAGPLSRFTCETCHFEGYVDGRTHHTGRTDVHATTKPLVGLVGNRPHFSRALDPDLATIAHAEFRVAGAGNDADPFFAIEPRELSWLAHLDVLERQEALDLRRALMRFLIDFSHRPNPAVIGRTAFAPLEQEGAVLFRDRCETCHAARLSSDDPATRVPFEQWEASIMSEAGPIVWGSAGYRRTGVLPLMHDEGTRTPSLRRLYKKFPYFTNGSAHALADVLDAVRFAKSEVSERGDRGFFHANAREGSQSLDDASKRALAAFLELL